MRNPGNSGALCDPYDGTMVFPNGNAEGHEGHQCRGAAHKRCRDREWHNELCNAYIREHLIVLPEESEGDGTTGSEKEETVKVHVSKGTTSGSRRRSD